jgi:anaerobic selenocysteine-containing dehydrogenase
MSMSAEDETSTHRIVCRICLGLCGVEVTVSGDRVLSVRGDKDHPVSHGYMCPKGHSYPTQHHRKDRLSYPSIRGVTVSWAECLRDIAGTAQRLIDEGGPDQVGCYVGTGAATDPTGAMFLPRLMHAIGSRQLYSASTVDIAPMFRAAEMVTGFASVFPSWDPESLDEPMLTILIGHNPVVSHGYINIPHFPDPTRRIRAYRARGGEVWVIDPRRTETAMRADRHLPIRPGTDAAVLAWLVRELLVDGADSHELATACHPEEVELLARAVEPFELNRVAALADVPAADLLDLLRAIRSHRRVAAASGTGVAFGRHGIVAEWLKWALQIVTGSLDCAGGMRFATSQPPTAFATPSPPNGAVQPGPPSRPELTGLFGQRPSAAIVDEIESGNLRGLFIGGGRPLTAFPNPDRVRQALQRLDMCVVVDTFENEMTELATHVLPAAWHLERRDMFFMTRQIDSPPVFAPVAERKPTWWMYGQIAKRLGRDLFAGALDVDTCTEEEVFRHIHAGRPNLDEVFAAGSYGIELARPVGWVHEHVLPEGRWRLVPPAMPERLPQVWEREETALRLIPGRRLRNSNAVVYALTPGETPGSPPIQISPSDASALGIIEGDRVRVATDRGQVEGIAHIDERLRGGVVNVAHGYLRQNVGALTDETEIDPLTGQPLQGDLPVTLTRIGPP